MDRRKTLKTLLVGSVTGAAVLSAPACKTKTSGVSPEVLTYYGRTPVEKSRDAKVKSEIFLNEHELSTIAVLCDIILPSTQSAGSALDAKVPDFIEFIVKDIPSHQIPMRGGLMWLDAESSDRFGSPFVEISYEQQIQIVDDIAYPDKEKISAHFMHGRNFFNLMRNLTLTGYYTTKVGIDDLGYAGNRPNVWDGVPADVLADHDVEFDDEWASKCVDQNLRDVMAEWDDDMNLIS